ncbi:ubiquitin carboxyl-terminal hydrolase [Toxoplasma gondii MAS]|uniref:ubiquitinyl hydrolase 1 n=1 Tax=Toxoplasma gondii MAS TaxID=943118 RepID=A0A086R0J8_TOXGO|nr:ubiquitin carboxyl-terminal hydrolase [Toxoplasma gondii MAS]
MAGGTEESMCACERAPPGLLNLGKTCSFNVLLQALASTRTFSNLYGGVWREQQRSRSPSTSELHDLVRKQQALLLLPGETGERGRPRSRFAVFRASPGVDASGPERGREVWCTDAAAVGRAAAAAVSAARMPLNFCMAEILGRMQAGGDTLHARALTQDNACPRTASQSPTASMQAAEERGEEGGSVGGKPGEGEEGAPAEDPEEEQKQRMRRQLRLKRQLQTKRWWIKQEQNVLSPFDFVSHMRMLNADFEQDVELDVEEVWRFLIQQIFTELQREQHSFDVSAFCSLPRGGSSPMHRDEANNGQEFLKGEALAVSTGGASSGVSSSDCPGFSGEDAFLGGLSRPGCSPEKKEREASRRRLGNSLDSPSSGRNTCTNALKTHLTPGVGESTGSPSAVRRAQGCPWSPTSGQRGGRERAGHCSAPGGSPASYGQASRSVSSPQRDLANPSHSLGSLRSSVLSHSIRGGGASEPGPRPATGAVAVAAGAFSSCPRMRTHCVRGLSPRSVPRKSELGREETEGEGGRADRRKLPESLLVSASFHFLDPEIERRCRELGAENAVTCSPIRKRDATENSKGRVTELRSSPVRLAMNHEASVDKAPGPSPRRGDSELPARAGDAGLPLGLQSPAGAPVSPVVKARLRLPTPGVKLEAPRCKSSVSESADVKSVEFSPEAGIKQSQLGYMSGKMETLSLKTEAKEAVKREALEASLAALAQRQSATLLLRQLQQALVGRLVQVPVPCSCCCRCDVDATVSASSSSRREASRACRRGRGNPGSRAGRESAALRGREKTAGRNEVEGLLPGAKRSAVDSNACQGGQVSVQSRAELEKRGEAPASRVACRTSPPGPREGAVSPASVRCSRLSSEKALSPRNSEKFAPAASPRFMDSGRSAKDGFEARLPVVLPPDAAPFPSSPLYPTLASHPACSPGSLALSSVYSAGPGEPGVPICCLPGGALSSLLSVESFCGVLPVRLPERSRWVSSRTRSNAVSWSESRRALSLAGDANSSGSRAQRLTSPQPITLEECLSLALTHSCGGAAPSGGAAGRVRARRRGEATARSGRPACSVGAPRRRVAKSQRRGEKAETSRAWRGSGCDAAVSPGVEGGKQKCGVCGKWQGRREGNSERNASGEEDIERDGVQTVETGAASRTRTQDTTVMHSVEEKAETRNNADEAEAALCIDTCDALSCYHRLRCHRCNQVHTQTFLERLPDILLFQLPRSSVTPPGSFGSGALKAAAAAAAGGGFKIKAHVEFPQRLESVIGPHCVASPAFEAACSELVGATKRGSSFESEDEGGRYQGRKRRKLSSQSVSQSRETHRAGRDAERATQRRARNSLCSRERSGGGGVSAAGQNARFLQTLRDDAAVYTLRAVIEHQGRSGVGGHYVCYRRGAPCDLVETETRETGQGESSEEGVSPCSSSPHKGDFMFSAGEDKARGEGRGTVENSHTHLERAEEETWWEVNDAEVTQTSWNHVRLSQAYILVYERCGRATCPRSSRQNGVVSDRRSPGPGCSAASLRTLDDHGTPPPSARSASGGGLSSSEKDAGEPPQVSTHPRRGSRRLDGRTSRACSEAGESGAGPPDGKEDTKGRGRAQASRRKKAATATFTEEQLKKLPQNGVKPATVNKARCPLGVSENKSFLRLRRKQQESTGTTKCEGAGQLANTARSREGCGSKGVFFETDDGGETARRIHERRRRNRVL